MPSGLHQVIVGLPIDEVWDFVKDMDHWAPLVPGYIHHQKINDRKSTWEFKSDLGFMKKKVSLMIDIKEWIEPTRVTFDLAGINEKFSGSGYFEAEAISSQKTKMTGYLDIQAEGPMAGMVNNILKTVIPKTAEEMAIGISAKLEKLKESSK
ncbi:CoxG family protein [Bacillus sp. CGMCC 1.16607]|uniref:CoxG family protein n=1 Tax=Bacillus sp. CGMCC 1.16607 TaxID=3351842 RepID=UPI003645653E